MILSKPSAASVSSARNNIYNKHSKLTEERAPGLPPVHLRCHIKKFSFATLFIRDVMHADMMIPRERLQTITGAQLAGGGIIGSALASRLFGAEYLIQKQMCDV